MTEHALAYDELMAIAFGQIMPIMGDAASTHIADCVHCQASISRVQTVRETVSVDSLSSPSIQSMNRVLGLIALRAPRQSRSRLETVRRLFGSLTFDSRQNYAAAGLRGGSDAYLLSYRQDKATLDLEIEPSVSTTSEIWHITGQLGVPGLTGPLDIALVGGRGSNSATNSDEFGVFSFAVEPGRYDVLVSLDNETLVFSEVEVGERERL